MQPNGLGDVLLLTPALRGLRRKYPDSFIACIGQYTELLQNNPNVDVCYDSRTEGRRSFVEFFTKADDVFAVDYFASHYELMRRHILELLCQKVGVDYDGGSLELTLTTKEVEWAKQIISEVTTPSWPTVAIQVDAAWTVNKEWLLWQWQRLVDTSDVQFIQIGHNRSPILSGAVNLCGKTTPREAAAIIEGCDVAIGPDSFIAHVAAALRKPAVILYGCTSPTNFGHSSHRNLHHAEVRCSPCNRPADWAFDLMEDNRDSTRLVPWVCPHRSCMKLITVNEVQRELLALLSNDRGRTEKNELIGSDNQ